MNPHSRSPIRTVSDFKGNRVALFTELKLIPEPINVADAAWKVIGNEHDLWKTLKGRGIPELGFQ